MISGNPQIKDARMKTEITKQLEKAIGEATRKQGVFGCFEVTIGWFGIERVDYITLDTNEIWRCYEIKASKKDFYSKAKKSFCGHFNYYVMPYLLYEQVKHDIPKHIGVINENGNSVKRATRQELNVDINILKNSLIRCLYRDAEKYQRGGDQNFIDRMNRRLREEKRKIEELHDAYRKLQKKYYELKYSPLQNKSLP